MSSPIAATLLASLGFFAGSCADAPDGTPADGRVEAVAASCTSCHEEQVRFWRYGGHAAVSCAVCHGVDGDHVASGAEPERPADESCFGCHGFGAVGVANPSAAEMLEHHLRVVEQKHVIKVDRGKVGSQCVSCHDPHSTQ